jgi:hypothetical protein
VRIGDFLLEQDAVEHALQLEQPGLGAPVVGSAAIQPSTGPSLRATLFVRFNTEHVDFV